MSTRVLRPGEVPIDVETVRRLVAGQFPQWADLPLAAAAEWGWDNATYRLGDTMSVRLPRLPRWVGQVEREHRWLPRLSPHLPLPIPVPLGRGEPAEGYPFPWSVYRWLDGHAADPDGLADLDGADGADGPGRIRDLHGAARRMAGFLTALQGVDATGGPPPEASNAFRGVSFADGRDSVITQSRVRERIADLDGVLDTGALTAVYEAALAAREWDGRPVWIHGDATPANLLARDGRIGAVIDFGTLAVGDPACDLLFAWTFLDAASRATFRAALPVDEATWARGRGWGLAFLLPSRDDLTGPHADPRRVAALRRRIDGIVADHREGGVTRVP